MEMLLVKAAHGLRGWTSADQQGYDRMRRRLAHMEPGECCRLEFSVPRNIGHHKKFMALVATVAEYSEVYDNKRKALTAVKIAAGHCDFMPDPTSGLLIPVPKSIAFANMEQGNFDEFYQDAVNSIIKHILPAMDRVSFDRALELVVNF